MKRAHPKHATIRVMLVDDHPVMRAALRAIIDSQADLTITGEAESGRAAVDLLKRARPDVVLMDASMPEMSGMETTRRLRRLQPKLKVVGLTLYGESSYLEEMVTVGAKGYVLKTSPPEKMIEAIRVVSGGGTYFDPAIPRSGAKAAPQPEQSSPGDLTGKELAVAKLVAQGQTNAEIANSLALKIPVIEKRRAAVMKKLGLRTRAELVRVAANRHWIDR